MIQFLLVAMDVLSPVVVPEPSTWLMMATGLLGIGIVAWRRRKEDQAA